MEYCYYLFFLTVYLCEYFTTYNNFSSIFIMIIIKINTYSIFRKWNIVYKINVPSILYMHAYFVVSAFLFLFTYIVLKKIKKIVPTTKLSRFLYSELTQCMPTDDDATPAPPRRPCRISRNNNCIYIIYTFTHHRTAHYWIM